MNTINLFQLQANIFTLIVGVFFTQVKTLLQVSLSPCMFQFDFPEAIQGQS